jgi:hypothetical protein
MQSASQIAEQAIAKQEAEEAGIVVTDDDKPKTGQDDPKAPAKDDDAGKPGAGDDSKKPDDKPDDTPKYDKDGKRIEPEEKKPDDPKKDDEGFTADDALEVDEPAPAATNEPPKDSAGIQLSPDEAKFIADNIGEPIVIRGIRGEGENAKEVEIKAYSPNDIPADFKFANDQQLAAATSGFQSLENKANQLLGTFRNNQSQTAAQEFQERENNGIRDDLADLQKEGRFPKFSVRPGEAGFDESPEAVQMAEVIDIMTKTNENYLKQYEQGRPYRHIGFAEAFEKWEKSNPDRQAAKKADDDQKAEDDERLNKANRGPSNRGTSPSNIVKPTVRPGTTTRDILARIDNEDF